MLGQIKDCHSPEEAKKYANCSIFVLRHELPALPDKDYYWADLIGLKVFNLENQYIGEILSLFETGANDVMVIKNNEFNQEMLVPFVLDHIIKQIDLTERKMIVEWQREWL